ncbi:MAG: signal peptidase I [Ignavibacteria bacterium]|nr:MAG: signal peptidase I [Ignavibacteria bacterium]
MKNSKVDFKEILKWKNLKKYLIEYGRLALILFIITSSFVQGSRVPTPSMETTIMTGDFLLVNKLAYDLTTPRNIPFTNIALPFSQLIKWNDPKRGDIVVFEFPGYRDEIKNAAIENYVKRCVAVPGDTVEVRNKVLFVNGKEAPIPMHAQYVRNYALPENFVDTETFPKGIPQNSDNYSPLVLPKKDDVIKLTSSNFEQWKTFIDREFERDVVFLRDGKVFVDGKETCEYKVRDDYYFMMGDNRDISLDCRFWGFVPRRNVVGKPMIAYWSWDSNIPTANIFELLASIRFNRIGKLVY